MKKLKIKSLLVLPVLAAGALAILSFVHAEKPKPKASKPVKYNVIYILADDLGYSQLACYGHKFNETPNLDKMASQGIKFTRFYAAAPVCSPYRAALMTGKYPARLKITDYLRPNSAQHLDTAETTLAEMFRDNGYHTGIVGKWHLSGYIKDGAPEETLPDKHGFQEVIVSENQGIAEGAYFWPYFWNKDIKKKLPGAHEYLTDRQNEEALEFIDRNKDKPFFLYLSHYSVHTQLQGKPDLVNHFRAKAGASKGAPSAKNPENDPYKRWPADYRSKPNNPHMAAMLFEIDKGVGMIMAKLKALHLDKNTIVVFTSDNGGETNVVDNTPLRGGKSMLYEGGVTEPFIIWNPVLFPKAEVKTMPLCNYDVYPTMMDLIHAKPNHQKFDGISFARILRSETAKMPERTFYWHYPLDKPHFLGGRSAGSIRRGDWKLIQFFDDGHKELYNLKDDIGEKNDLAAKNPAKVTELTDALVAWRKSVGATEKAN